MLLFYKKFIRRILFTCLTFRMAQVDMQALVEAHEGQSYSDENGMGFVSTRCDA
jgi:hypothetical protein